MSKTIVFTCFIVWIASPFLIKIPFLAPIPEPTVRDIGTARPSAHGQAITKTETAIPIDLLGSELAISHAKNVIIAKPKIIGTKTPVILSANFCIGTLFLELLQLI